MRKLKLYLCITVVVCLIAGGSNLLVGQGVGGSASFLRFGQDARALGMGGSFVAIANNYSTPYWNPAGLAISNGSRVGFMYTQPYQVEDLNLVLISGKTKLGDMGLGGGFTRFFADLSASWSGEGENSLSYRESVYNLAAAYRIEGIGLIGGAVKHYSLGANGTSLEGREVEASGWGFDLGFIHELAQVPVKIGASVLDFGNTEIRWKEDLEESADKVPVIYKVGAAYLIDSIDLLAAFEYDFTSAQNIDKNLARNVLHLGAEYRPISQLALRAGAVMPLEEQIYFTGGVGLHWDKLIIDFAWRQNKTGLEQAAYGSATDTIILSAEFIL